MAVPFLEVILHTLLQTTERKGKENAFEMREDEERRNKIKRVIQQIAKFGIPSAYLLFIISFMIFGIIVSLDDEGKGAESM